MTKTWTEIAKEHIADTRGYEQKHQIEILSELLLKRSGDLDYAEARLLKLLRAESPETQIDEATRRI